MAVRAVKIYEYWVECDECGNGEMYHTGDQDNGVTVHSMDTAKRAATYHKCGKMLLCPICYENYVYERIHSKRK